MVIHSYDVGMEEDQQLRQSRGGRGVSLGAGFLVAELKEEELLYISIDGDDSGRDDSGLDSF